jgi:hypothetical protein
MNVILPQRHPTSTVLRMPITMEVGKKQRIVRTGLFESFKLRSMAA